MTHAILCASSPTFATKRALSSVKSESRRSLDAATIRLTAQNTVDELFSLMKPPSVDDPFDEEPSLSES